MEEYSEINGVTYVTHEPSEELNEKEKLNLLIKNILDTQKICQLNSFIILKI